MTVTPPPPLNSAEMNINSLMSMKYAQTHVCGTCGGSIYACTVQFVWACTSVNISVCTFIAMLT